jgi:hypothetical protein
MPELVSFMANCSVASLKPSYTSGIVIELANVPRAMVIRPEVGPVKSLPAWAVPFTSCQPTTTSVFCDLLIRTYMRTWSLMTVPQGGSPKPSEHTRTPS